MIWFTADTHFYHTNILKYCKRPFKNVNDMNHTIIVNWNNKVEEGDTVFHLGDFSFGHFKELKKQLNGNIILIKGNHDHNNQSIIKDMIIEHGGRYWHLVHNPEDCEGEHCLCGHIHEKWKIKKDKNKLMVNVGVDQWNYKPISIKDINKEIKIICYKKHQN